MKKYKTKTYSMSELEKITGFTWNGVRKRLETMGVSGASDPKGVLRFDLTDAELEVLCTPGVIGKAHHALREKNRQWLRGHMQKSIPKSLIAKQTPWLTLWGIIPAPEVTTKASYTNKGFMSQK